MIRVTYLIRKSHGARLTSLVFLYLVCGVDVDVVACLKVSSCSLFKHSQTFPEIKNRYLRMSSFPSNFRDLGRFAEDGLEFSTTSNTAVKMYDALVNMVREYRKKLYGCLGKCWQILILGRVPLQQPPAGWVRRGQQGDVLCRPGLCHGEGDDLGSRGVRSQGGNSIHDLQSSLNIKRPNAC